MTFHAANNVLASSLLPFQRNELFIGREQQLQQLEQNLYDPNHHKRMTLYGLGGSGKSALALEFMYRALARDASLLVFWVPALNQESFELAYRNIAKYLRIPGIFEDNADIIALVKETLSSGSSGDWLMVVDNADDLSIMFGNSHSGRPSVQLKDCVPASNQGTVLFTTRTKDIAKVLTPDSFLELNEPSKAEAGQLLARRVTQQALLNGETAVDELLGTLAYFPLAIVQAAAFINNNHMTVSDYTSLFRHPGADAELFREHFQDPDRYPDMDNTIATTWHISFNQLRRQNPLAAKYLSFMACTERFNIPQSLLPTGGTPVQQTKAIGSLLGYAFITERQQTGQGPHRDRFFDMHRLVHMASIGWLSGQNEWANWMASAVARLEEQIPTEPDQEKKEFWTTYLPHAIYVSGLDNVGKVAKGSLLHRVANCQSRLGQYSPATATYRQALTVRVECLGWDHPDTLYTMNGLAIVHNSMGKFKEAVSLDERTLAGRKKVLGLDDEATLTSMHNLAIGYKNVGKYAEAEKLYKYTMERQEKLFGLKHVGRLSTMSHLAELMAIQNDYREADRLYSSANTTQREMYGDRHPVVLLTSYGLAKVQERVMDDADGWSERAFRDVLQIQEEVLGPDHPHTLITVQSLACLRARLGHFQESEAMFRRILAKREEILGPGHLQTVATIHRLAWTLCDQRRWKEALPLFSRAATGFYTLLGENHPTYTDSVKDLTKCQLKDYDENGVGPYSPPPVDDWKVPTYDINGHPNGNTEPWAENLLPKKAPEIEVTTGKKPKLARSWVAKMGIRKLFH
jgi:tetratricopeptide (TPR) repeat protein